MSPEQLTAVSERRRLDPLTCLLMWLTALNADPVREALRLLEVGVDELYGMFSGLEYEQAQMRRLRMVCELFTRELLGKLARGRLTEMLMQCQKPADCAALLKAAGQLPDWVLDDRPAVVNVWDDRGRPFERPDILARAAAQAFTDAGYEIPEPGDGASVEGDGAPGNDGAGNGDGGAEDANSDISAHGNGASASAADLNPTLGNGAVDGNRANYDESNGTAGHGTANGSGGPSLEQMDKDTLLGLAQLAGLGELSPAEEALLSDVLDDIIASPAGPPGAKPKPKPKPSRGR
jgi:hypothetical protein